MRELKNPPSLQQVQGGREYFKHEFIANSKTYLSLGKNKANSTCAVSGASEP